MTLLVRSMLLALALNALRVSALYAESIPLKSEGGTFVVPVVINNKITLDFTLDSGASDVSIPADVFSTLQRTQTITKADLLDSGEYELADGSTARHVRFRIRSLKVGNLELRDVVGSVAPARGGLLLGQSFLSRLQSWAVDNRRHVLVMNEGVTQTASNQQSSPTANNSGSAKETFFKDIHGCLFFNAFPDPGEQMQWDGSCEGGYAHGPGSLETRTSNNVHLWDEGTMENGKFEGSVESTADNGYHFVCNYRAGFCEGHGEAHYADGGTYEGMFYRGVRTGHGILTLPNHDRYEGDFVAGAPEGRGVIIYWNGDRYEGQVRAGRPEGHGTFIYDNGARWEGNFVAGRRAGKGTYVGAMTAE
jgi:clan AA aspartic protease (TIGR02281 family)